MLKFFTCITVPHRSLSFEYFESRSLLKKQSQVKSVTSPNIREKFCHINIFNGMHSEPLPLVLLQNRNITGSTVPMLIHSQICIDEFLLNYSPFR